jgi:hypothetical protein
MNDSFDAPVKQLGPIMWENRANGCKEELRNIIGLHLCNNTSLTL